MKNDADRLAVVEREIARLQSERSALLRQQAGRDASADSDAAAVPLGCVLGFDPLSTPGPTLNKVALEYVARNVPDHTWRLIYVIDEVHPDALVVQANHALARGFGSRDDVPYYRRSGGRLHRLPTDMFLDLMGQAVDRMEELVAVMERGRSAEGEFAMRVFDVVAAAHRLANQRYERGEPDWASDLTDAMRYPVELAHARADRRRRDDA